MKKVSFLGNAITYSLIISIFAIVLALVYYIFNIEMFSGASIASSLIIGLLILVGAFVFGVKNYREKALGGKITFWNAFLQAFTIGIFGYIVIAIFNYVFYAFIAPEYAAVQIDGFVSFMEGFAGMPEQAFDEAVADFESNMNPMGQMIQAIKSGAIMSLIVGLIVAASIKKDTNQAQIS